MHLTNYSVNKHSNLFGQTDDAGTTGSKRSLKFLFDHFNRNNIDASKVWKNIQVNIMSLQRNFFSVAVISITI